MIIDRKKNERLVMESLAAMRRENKEWLSACADNLELEIKDLKRELDEARVDAKAARDFAEGKR